MEDKFEHIKNQYSKAVEKYGDSPESLLWPKGRQDIRFNNLISPLKNIITKETLSLCDFGCGLAHLEEYIINKKINLEYKGLDFVPSLIDLALEKGRNVELIGNESLPLEKFDCFVASGVFNIKYYEDINKNQDYVFNKIDSFFNCSPIYVAIDFMRPDVDFIQDGAWHQPYEPLINFLNSYSREIELILRPLPYEYTVRVYL